MNGTEKFLREVNQAFSEGNKDFLLNNITDDFSWIIVGEKTVGGRAEFSDALDQMVELPMKIKVTSIVTAGDFAVVEGIVVGRNRNNQRKNFGFCDLFQFSGEVHKKIQRMTSYVIDISKHKQYRESF